MATIHPFSGHQRRRNRQLWPLYPLSDVMNAVRLGQLRPLYPLSDVISAVGLAQLRPIFTTSVEFFTYAVSVYCVRAEIPLHKQSLCEPQLLASCLPSHSLQLSN